MKIYRIFLPFIFLFILSVGCKSEPKEKEIDYYASPLFIDVQMQALFEDSKTFVDLVPKDSYYALNKKLKSLEILRHQLVQHLWSHFYIVIDPYM